MILYLILALDLGGTKIATAQFEYEGNIFAKESRFTHWRTPMRETGLILVRY